MANQLLLPSINSHCIQLSVTVSNLTCSDSSEYIKFSIVSQPGRRAGIMWLKSSKKCYHLWFKQSWILEQNLSLTSIACLSQIYHFTTHLFSKDFSKSVNQQCRGIIWKEVIVTHTWNWGKRYILIHHFNFSPSDCFNQSLTCAESVLSEVHFLKKLSEVHFLKFTFWRKWTLSPSGQLFGGSHLSVLSSKCKWHIFTFNLVSQFHSPAGGPAVI